MAPTLMTREGRQWNSTGWTTGLLSISVVTDRYARALNNAHYSNHYDVIVVGAGYAGLIAARDLALQGFQILLLEGRDRIGGRAFTAVIDGFPYEMGAQWVHWHQPHLWREAMMYEMDGDLVATRCAGGEHNHCCTNFDNTKKELSHDTEAAYFIKLWELFCNVDNVALKNIIPFPFRPLSNLKDSKHWDKLSAQDRLDQIKDSLTAEEVAFFTCVLHQLSGSPLSEIGFLDVMQWWVLGDYHATGLNDYGLTYKFRQGQSELVCRIFDHAVQTENLSYRFSCTVTKITQKMEADRTELTVTSDSGQSWVATSVICTIPLNALPGIQFSPPLCAQKTEAIKAGHTNQGNKVHVNVDGDAYKSWSSYAHPGKGLTCAFADNVTPTGHTHLCAFGPSESAGGLDLGAQDINQLRTALNELSVPEPKQVLYHDWANDPFSMGTWSFYRPNYATKYLEVLQQRHLNIHFASADWANGWRGWIDGAVQQGGKVAFDVAAELKKNARKGDER